MTDEFNPSPRLADRFIALTKEVRGWSNVTRNKLLFRLASLGLRDRVRLQGEVALRKSLKTSLKVTDLEVERVSFIFARHGIFLEHGVGKGRPKGSASARRFAKPWLRPVLEPELETLAELLADEYGDIIAAELVIRIPGIIDTKVNK